MSIFDPVGDSIIPQHGYSLGIPEDGYVVPLIGKKSSTRAAVDHGLFILGIPKSSLRFPERWQIPSSGPFWPRLRGIFDMRHMTASTRCKGLLKTDFPDYVNHIDETTIFSIGIRFPNMFRDLTADDKSPKDLQLEAVQTIVDNLVKKPWYYEPPGGLFLYWPKGTQLYAPTVGSSNVNDITGTLGHPPTIDEPATGRELIGWDKLDDMLTSTNDTYLETNPATVEGGDWSKWNQPFGVNTRNWEVSEKTMFTLGYPSNGESSAALVKVNLNNVYAQFSGLKQNESVFGSDSVFPGSLAIEMQATIQGMTTPGSEPGDVILDCMTSFRKFNKFPPSDSKGYVHVFKCTEYDDEANRKIIANIVRQLKHGLNIPVNLKEINTGDGGANMYEYGLFKFELAIHVCGGGWSFRLSQSKQSQTILLGLKHSTTARWSNRLRVSSIDFNTSFDTLGSLCSGKCRYTHCPNLNNGAYPISGNCNGRGDYFDKVRAGAETLITNFQLSARSVNSGEQFIIQYMLNTITKIQGLSSYFNKMPQSIKNTFDDIRRYLNQAKSDVDDITGQLIILSTSTYNSDAWSTKVACIDANRSSISEITHDIQSIHKNVITQFQRIVDLTGTAAYKAAVADDTNKPDMTAVVATINSAMANMDDSLKVLLDAANDATDGTTSHPERDDNDKDSADQTRTDLDSSDDSNGLPKWSIYTMAGVGSLIVIGVIVGVAIHFRKKNQ